MPERSFGRTVRYRRTKLGISQARLGQLVGRSAATVRSWEADKTTPNDAAVVSVLAAIIGIDERTLFEKAGLDKPIFVETSPTIEEALASLAPEAPAETLQPESSPEDVDRTAEAGISIEDITEPVLIDSAPENIPLFDPMDDDAGIDLEELLNEYADAEVSEADPVVDDTVLVAPVRHGGPMVYDPAVSLTAGVVTPTGGNGHSALQSGLVAIEASYIEDPVEKRFYQLRTLATVGGLVLLGMALLWALGEGMGAISGWWSDFFEQLRL